MTSEDFKMAGELARAFRNGKLKGVTDEELELIIETQSLVLEFLRARGPEWQLAITPLTLELETEWKSYQRARAQDAGHRSTT